MPLPNLSNRQKPERRFGLRSGWKCGEDRYLARRLRVNQPASIRPPPSRAVVLGSGVAVAVNGAAATRLPVAREGPLA